MKCRFAFETKLEAQMQQLAHSIRLQKCSEIKARGASPIDVKTLRNIFRKR